MSSEEKSKDIEIELNIDGKDYKVGFLRVVDVVTERDCGADADGNRGVRMSFIDTDEATDIYVNDKPLKEYSEGFRQQVVAEIDVYLSDNDFDLQ